MLAVVITINWCLMCWVFKLLTFNYYLDLWNGRMDNVPADKPSSPPTKASEVQTPAVTDSGSTNPTLDAPSKLSSWAKSLKIPQPFATSQENSPTGNAGKSTFSRFTSGFGLRLSPKSPASDSSDGASVTMQPGFLGTITKGIVDSSKNAVKAVQVKARHVVSQNKRRYQVGCMLFFPI